MASAFSYRVMYAALGTVVLFACLHRAIAAPTDPAISATDADPYLWLEDLKGAKALDWVTAQNAKTEAGLASTAQFKQLDSDLRGVMNSEDKIPEITKIGDYYYNYLQDKTHKRGIWRRTTLDEYRKPSPKWETMLDLDALNLAEHEDWAWSGAKCLRPAYQRCLVALSRGGADATVTREFDLGTKQWVKAGFFRPEAKGSLSWIDEDTVYVATDFGAGTTTNSGYARIAKRWKRGTPLSAAITVYEAKPEDLRVEAFHDHTPGFERDFVSHQISGERNELYLLDKDRKLHKIDAPDSATKEVKREWLTLLLREPLTTGGKTYAAGALLATRLDDFIKGERRFDVLFEPTETISLNSSVWTRSHLVLSALDNVKARLSVLTPGPQGWTRSPFVGAPELGVASIDALDSDESDALWLTASDLLQPTTLSLVKVGSAPVRIKSLRPLFDSSHDVAEQHFATSKDGTRVPYFLVRPKSLKFDGQAPTLIYGYGGFGAAMLPHYASNFGKAWYEKGGVFVLANLRGGGEYGPRWRLAAQRQNRHKAYEDMAAIANDLIASKITSPKRLGVMGGSNGGLMTGNMLIRYPELFGAVVIDSPLLDMKRYTHLLAGASWIDEFGNPDTDDWSFIHTFSPYHLFDPDKNYPPVLILTSIRDDRVHPGHARKMAAKMLDAGKDVTYYESMDGGHANAGDTAQAAYRQALMFAFLWQRLGGSYTAAERH